jgi:ligand-binding SRPBCC domain-containing protein
MVRILVGTLVEVGLGKRDIVGVTSFKGFFNYRINKKIENLQTQYKEFEKKYFIDIQLYGPYALWHHKHFIHEIEGGVELEDIIDYKVPLGIVGQLAHPFLVKPKLEEIFNYRQQKLLELFGEYQSNEGKN